MGKDSWFTCTTSDTNPTGNFQISLCKLSEDINGNKIQVEKLIPLNGPDLYRCEKNWLPFTKDGHFFTVYSYDPFIIYKPDLKTGDCETALHYEPTLDFTRFRGSAGPIEFDGGYLLLVHEVVHHLDYSRVYLHRFLYLDQHYNITRLSKPFIFKHQGVEFCASMTADHLGSQLVMSLGIEDREAYLCFVDFDTIHSMLNPLRSNF